MQKATEPQTARCCWSEYKHRYTVKILAGIAPCGAITYTSEGYGGRISYPQIEEVSGWLHLLEKMDLILADKGFLIDEILSTMFAQPEAPPRKYNKVDTNEDKNDQTS